MFKPLFADDSPKQLPIEPEKTPAPSRTLDHRFSGARPISSSSFVHILAILFVASSTWRWGNNDQDNTFKVQQWSRPSRPNNQLLPSSHSTWFPILNVSSRAEKRSKSLKQWSLTILFVGKTFCWKRRTLLSFTSDKNWKIQRSCREVMRQQSVLKTVKS